MFRYHFKTILFYATMWFQILSCCVDDYNTLKIVLLKFNQMKKVLFITLSLLLAGTTLAQKKKDKNPPKTEEHGKLKAFSEVITSKAKSKNGLINGTLKSMKV